MMARRGGLAERGSKLGLVARSTSPARELYYQDTPTRLHPLPVPPRLLLSPLVWYTMTSNFIGASVSPPPPCPAYPVLTRQRQANIAPTAGPSTTTQVPGTQSPAATPQSVDPKVHSVDSKAQPPAAAAANAQDGAQAPPKPYYKFNVKMTCSGCSGAIDRVLKKNITSRTSRLFLPTLSPDT
jgi:hypothetical protein